MRGYDVNFELYGSATEISRRLILPERLSFKQLEQIIIRVFGFSGERFPEFNFRDGEDSIDSDSPLLIDGYITRPIIYDYYWLNDVHYGVAFDWRDALVCEFAYPWCDESDNPDNWRVLITLNETLDYDRNFPSFKSYVGKSNPISGRGGINTFNTMLLKSHELPEIDPKSVQEELSKIRSVKYSAYDITIRCENISEEIWRDFLIPEKTTFLELEEMIIIAFDTSAVSFGCEKETVDESFRRKFKTYSSDRNFSVEVKKRIFSTRHYPILKDFKGGNDPFDLWYEYYPDESKREDKFQSNLDEFF